MSEWIPDLIEAGQSLDDFKGVVACGGISYGDAPGAGGGWAKTILHNPSGSVAVITGVTTADGRFTIVMPQPECVFCAVQMSWQPPCLGEDSPWMRMFRNARRWVG